MYYVPPVHLEMCQAREVLVQGLVLTSPGLRARRAFRDELLRDHRLAVRSVGGIRVRRGRRRERVAGFGAARVFLAHVSQPPRASLRAQYHPLWSAGLSNCSNWHLRANFSVL